MLEGTREGAKTVFVDRWRGMGWERQLHRVGAILRDFPGVTLRMDGTGAGDPVVEWARRLLPDLAIQSTVLGAENKRSLMENLAVLLQSATLALPDHRELVDELLAFVKRPSGRIEGSGSHDDLVCALGLAANDLPVRSTWNFGVGRRRE